MVYKLNYQSESEINCVFYKIGTPEGLKRWTESKSSQSYSLVVYIKEHDLQPFQEIAEILMKTGHRFKRSRKLHCTLFSLSGNPTQDDIQSICNRIQSFFKTKKLGQLKVYFDIIHPGKDEHYDHISDSAVIALSRRDLRHGYGFLSLINDLESHLVNQGCSRMIGKRKTYDTIWCTLGYFDEPQFEVDSAIYSAFSRPELRAFSASATFDEIVLTEYRLKSLDDGKTIFTIKL